MFCENCGKEIKDNDAFCPNCGKAMQEEKTSNSSDVKNENPNAESKKKKSGKPIAMLGVVAIVIAVIILAMKMFGGNSNAKEIVEKLKASTTVDKTENGYEFTYDDMWTLCYTEDSVVAVLSEPILSEYFEKVWEIGELGDDGTVRYNLENENLNVYCDAEFEGEDLSVITYDVKKDELTFIVDGERYELKKEYAQQFKDDDIASVLKFDIESFEDDLKEIDLTKDDVANLTYKDIKANVDDKELKTANKEEKKPESKNETELEEQIESEETFIGMNGRYNYTDSDGNVISFIEISKDGQFCNFSLRNTELNYDIVGGSGRVMDSKTIHIPVTGYTIICTWLDSEHVKVTREGDPYGMDAGPIMDFTDGRVYEYINLEENTLVKDAYKFLVGNRFHLIDSQPTIYFISEDEVCYSPGGEQRDKYYYYKISLKTESYHNEQVWREYITVGKDEYRLQYFSDGTISLEGNGIFSGRYEII